MTRRCHFQDSTQDLLAENLTYQRVEVTLLSVLAGLALLLSAVGVYGLVSNLVAQRTKVIGLRMALGSSTQQAMLNVGSVGLTSAVIGIVVGLGILFVAVRFLRSELYGIGQYDPLTLTVVPLILVAISAAASYLQLCGSQESILHERYEWNEERQKGVVGR